MTTTISQSEYNALMERFRAAMRLTFMLNVCHGDGPCSAGCIGRVTPPAVQLRCPAIAATPEQLEQAQAEYDAALAAISGVEVEPQQA